LNGVFKNGRAGIARSSSEAQSLSALAFITL
jgi:hypothetical protein